MPKKKFDVDAIALDLAPRLRNKCHPSSTRTLGFTFIPVAKGITVPDLKLVSAPPVGLKKVAITVAKRLRHLY